MDKKEMAVAQAEEKTPEQEVPQEPPKKPKKHR